MRVPKYIQDKMHRLAKLSNQAADLSREIDRFFIEKGYDIEALRSGDGISLEELEYGVDVTELICKAIESDVYGKTTEFNYSKYVKEL